MQRFGVEIHLIDKDLILLTFKRKMRMKKKMILFTVIALLVGVVGCEDKTTQYEIYENHDISACGIEDPLRNIEWLSEYCRKIKEQKKDLNINIYLLKVIDKEEYIFQTVYPSQIEHYFSMSYRNCLGDIVFHWESINPPNPQYEDFMEDKEYLGRLFSIVKH